MRWVVYGPTRARFAVFHVPRRPLRSPVTEHRNSASSGNANSCHRKAGEVCLRLHASWYRKLEVLASCARCKAALRGSRAFFMVIEADGSAGRGDVRDLMRGTGFVFLEAAFEGRGSLQPHCQDQKCNVQQHSWGSLVCAFNPPQRTNGRLVLSKNVSRLPLRFPLFT